MAVGGTPVGPVLAGPILARASYIKVYILGKFILLRRKFCPKVFVTIYYTIWYGKYGKEEEGIITHKDTDYLSFSNLNTARRSSSRTITKTKIDKRVLK